MSHLIHWHPLYCGGDGGNACLQLGHDTAGTLHLRETAEPDHVIATTPAALTALADAARRGTLPSSRSLGSASSSASAAASATSNTAPTSSTATSPRPA